MTPPTWHPCSEKPPRYALVLIYRRIRPYCRFGEPIVGWWDGRDWRREDSHHQHTFISNPLGWTPLHFPAIPVTWPTPTSNMLSNPTT